MIITLRPQPKQHLAYQLLDESNTDLMFLLFGGGAGGGKSWLVCEWEMAMCERYPGVRYFLGRKELTRLMSSTYLTFRKVCQWHKIPQSHWKLNGQYHYIQFRNGSRIDLLDCDYKPSDPDYERFGSLEYTGGALEEVGEIRFKAFDVLKIRIGRHKNQEYKIPPKLVLTSNPTKNWVYSVFYRPWKGKTLPKEYGFVRALYRDNIYTAEEYEKLLNQIKDRTLRQRLKNGIWEYEEEEGRLVDYDAILDLFTNTLAEPATEATLITKPIKPEKFLIVDVARFGKSKIIFMVWEGFDCKKIVVKTHQGTDVTENDIKTLLRDEKIPYSHCLVDASGIGGGISDHIKGIKEFISNSPPIVSEERERVLAKQEYQKENFKTLKDQCGFLLADKINQHEIAISAEISEDHRQELIEEVEQLKGKDLEADAKKQLIPKEEIIEAIGRSPDFLDTLLMRMFFEVAKEKRIISSQPSEAVKPYYGDSEVPF